MSENCDLLAEKSCVPCKGGVPPLKGDVLKELHASLGNDWELVKEHHIEKTYKFDNFVEALAFVNKVGEIAEAQNHHPEIELGYGRAKIMIWTHKIDGLAESDFVLAAKVEKSAA